jgi:gliding motility-associated-like protein
MRFRIFVLFILICFTHRALADGCNNGPFTVQPNCDPNGNPLEVCFNPGGTSDQPPDTDYSWDFGDGGTATYSGSANTICHTYAAPGTYTVTLTLVVDMGFFGGDKTCVSTLSVTVDAAPFNYSVTQTFDCNTNTGSLNLTMNPSTGVKWDWDADTLDTNLYPAWPFIKDIATSDNNTSLTIGPGEQHYILIQKGSCFYTETFSTTGFVLSTDSVDITCYNANDGAIGATISGGTAPYTFTWSNGFVQTSTGISTVSSLAAGTFTVTVTDASGCSATDAISVNNPPEVVSDAGPDVTICSATTGNIGAASTALYTYSWSPATGLSDATISNPTVTLTNTGTSALSTTYTVTTTDGTCTTTDEVVVTVNPLPTVDAGMDGTICSGSATTLAGIIGGGATSGTWSGGSGTFSPNNTTLTAGYSPGAADVTAGTVTLTLTTDDPAGPCPSASDQMVLTVNPAAEIDAGPSLDICIGGSAVLAGVVSGASTSGTWSGGNGTFSPDNTTANAVYTPSSTENAAGTVTLTFTSDDPPGPCPGSSDQMTITIHQLPTANAGSAQSVCEGESITLAGSVGGTATSGTWSGGSGTYNPNNTTLNAVYTPSAAEYAAGSVQLTLTTDDPAGPCNPSSSNVTFSFYENPVIDFSVDVPSGCPVHCVNFTDLSTVGGGATIDTWIWNFGDGSSSNIQSPANCFEQTGFYDITLTATSSQNCTSTLTIPQMIQVFALPVAEFTPSPNPATVLDPVITMQNQSSSDVNYWDWDFGDTTSLLNVSSPVYTFPNQASSNYTVTLIVHNADNCYDTVTHTVFIGPEFTFFIPNAFSPNGDGVNDSFFGSGIGIVEYDLWIFDRWGNMVFHTENLSEYWDGKANSGKEMAQQDVFVWKVELTDVFHKKHQYVGTVTIVK